LVDSAEAASANPAIDILRIQSDHPAGFCTGWAPEVLPSLGSSGDAAVFTLEATGLLDRLAALPIVTVATLTGACHGLGLELALACDDRLGTATMDARLHFGDLPTAAGGLTRLLRRVGPRRAAAFLREPAPIAARHAAQLGLIDHVYSARRGQIEWQSWLDAMTLRPRKRGRRFFRPLAFWLARQDHAEFLKTLDPSQSPLPPAQMAILQQNHPAAERAAFARLLHHPVVQATLAAQAQFPTLPAATPPKVLGLVGAFETLAPWAMEWAARGSRILWHAESAGPDRVFPRQALAAKLTPLEADTVFQQIQFIEDWERFAEVECVIAAAPCPKFVELEAHLPRHATLVLRGSAIMDELPLAERPGRVLGWTVTGTVHELSRTSETDPRQLARLQKWLGCGGRTLVVADAPRTPLRRLQAAFWDEATRLVAEGYAPQTIDHFAQQAGFAAPPLATMDTLPWDELCAEVQRLEPLRAAGGERFYCAEPDNPPMANPVAQVLLWDAHALDAYRHN
ncbi:MAG: enoyl-CoA hydratase-related protein, partial [Gemmataceae bacterium]